MAGFINLRNHTHFTLQLGVGTVEDHIKATKAKGQKGFAITDKMTLGGAIEAYKLCAKEKVPFVMGAVLHFIEKRTNQNHESPFTKIVVFAKNYKGYQNLCQMLAKASTEKYFYYKPRVDWELLVAHKEGLIVSTGDYQSPFGKYIEEFSKEDEEWFLKFKQEFGEDFYTEICLQDVSLIWSKEQGTFIQEANSQVFYNQRMIELAKKHGVKMYVSAPAYMPDASYHFVQTAMIRNTKGNNGWHFPKPLFHVSEDDLEQFRTSEHDYISQDELAQMKETSLEIFEKCKGLRFDTSIHLPVINYEAHPAWNNQEVQKMYLDLESFCKKEDENFYDLIQIAKQEKEKGLRLALLIVLELGKIDLYDKEYRDRLLQEILTVQRNGMHRLMNYFLEEEDVNRFVINSGELRGFGRGSGASYLLNYALDITDLDPIKYRLLPDRFLSLDRIGVVYMDVDTTGLKLIES